MTKGRRLRRTKIRKNGGKLWEEDRPWRSWSLEDKKPWRADGRSRGCEDYSLWVLSHITDRKSEGSDFRKCRHSPQHWYLGPRAASLLHIGQCGAFSSQDLEPDTLESGSWALSLSGTQGHWCLGSCLLPICDFYSYRGDNPQLFVITTSANGFWRTALYIFDESIRVFNDFSPMPFWHHDCPLSSKVRRQDDFASEVAYVAWENAFPLLYCKWRVT